MQAPPRRSLRFWVSVASGYLLAFSVLFTLQELIFGFLPIWNILHIGPLPSQPLLFIATSLWITHRYVRVEAHQ